MKSTSKTGEKNILLESCPFLGLKDDRVTYSAFPSQWNVCYHVNPVNSPELSHQRAYCLQLDHVECPVFNQKPGLKMPKQIQYQAKGLPPQVVVILKYVGFGLLALLVILAILFRGLWLPVIFDTLSPAPTHTEQRVLQSFTPTSTAQMIVVNPPTAETIVIQATATPTQPPPTETPLPPTPTKTNPPLALETPIGLDYQFVIHRVEEGESLELFTNWYSTSVEAIQAINLDGVLSPLWPGVVIVIPFRNTDVSGLPVFEPYEVVGEDTSIETLAENFSVAVEDLYLYNNLEPGHIIRVGDWILIPRDRTTP